MLDDWEAFVAARDDAVCVTVTGKRPSDVRAIGALHDACARLHTAIARSDTCTDDIGMEVSIAVRCKVCVTFRKREGWSLCGVLADLADCPQACDDAADAGTRILRHSSVPPWHLVNTLALELDVTLVQQSLADGAMLVHVLEIADFLRLQNTLDRSRQVVSGLLRMAGRDRIDAAQRCDLAACMQAVTTLPESVLQTLVYDQSLSTLLSKKLPACLVSSWFRAHAADSSPVCIQADKAAATFDQIACKLVGTQLPVQALHLQLQGFACDSRLPDAALDALAAFTALERLTVVLNLAAGCFAADGRVPLPLLQLCAAMPPSIRKLELHVNGQSPPTVFGGMPSGSGISFGAPGMFGNPPPKSTQTDAFGFGSSCSQPPDSGSMFAGLPHRTPAELAKSLARLPQLQHLGLPRALQSCVETDGRWIDCDGLGALQRVQCKVQQP